MASPFLYFLAPLQEREADDAWEGTGFPTGGRTRWTFTLHVAKLAASGSVTVRIEAAPEDDDSDYSTLYTFSAQSSTGSTTIAFDDDPAPFTVQSFHKYLRAVQVSQTGDAIWGVEAYAPFVDPTLTADKNLLTKGLRDWSDGLTRIVEQAEDDVRNLLLDRQSMTGRLEIELNRAGAYEAVRREIARQADHLFWRHELNERARSGDTSAIVTVRDGGRLAPGLGDDLSKFRAAQHAYWRGR